jgi:hypothetical protein
MAFIAAAAIVVGGTYLASRSASSAAESAANAQRDAMSQAAASSTEIAKIQADTAKEYLDFQKTQYADMKPLAESISKAQLDVMKQQTDIAAANEDRASKYYDYEQKTFRPVEEQIVKEAQDYNTDAKREALASRGMADVAQAYDQQRQQAMDTLARYGINPNSARFAAINASLSNSEAAARAGAATNARQNAEQLGYARMIDAASLGRNLASNSSTAYGIATNAGNSASNNGTSALNTAAAPGAALGGAYGSFNTMMGNAGNSYANAGSLYGAGYKIAAGQQAASDSATAGLIGMAVKGGIGYAAGNGWGGAATALTGLKFADGGKVHKGRGAVKGPGGPVDDKVPAMLSNGEYVLPADTVRAIGVKKLDKVVSDTHTPASVQRRHALKGA